MMVLLFRVEEFHDVIFQRYRQELMAISRGFVKGLSVITFKVKILQKRPVVQLKENL